MIVFGKFCEQTKWMIPKDDKKLEDACEIHFTSLILLGMSFQTPQDTEKPWERYTIYSKDWHYMLCISKKF